MRRPLRVRGRALLAATLALCAATACAHDTWFERHDDGVLALGTGNRFPRQEYALSPAQLGLGGCHGRDGAALPLRPVGTADHALLLRPAAGAAACWAETLPLDIELDAALVAVYLQEIGAPPQVHAAWAALRARGVGWRERYVKNARIELPGPPAPARASGIGLEVTWDAPARELRPGDEVSFTVRRDGRPLGGLALQLRSERSPFGLWQRSDAGGRVTFRLPLAGRWVLRGTELRPPAADGEPWQSRFVTLAFDVGPAAVRGPAAAD